MENNFLYRKKNNINLFNKKSYRASNTKDSSVHPLLGHPINPIVSKIDTINDNNLGYYIPINNYQIDNNKKIKYYIHEHNMIIDSMDRNIDVYTNPLNFTVKLHPLQNDIMPYIIRPPINNVKYINVLNVMLPLYHNLHKIVTNTDNDFKTFVDQNIDSFKIGDDIVYQKDTIQICNIYKENNNWEINYTINKEKNPSFSLVKNNTDYKTYKYNYFLQKEKVVYLNIKEFNDYNTYSTSDLRMCAPLYPRYVTKKFINYKIKKGLILFKNSDLRKISRLEISFTDDNNQIIKIPLLDNKVLRKNCYCNENCTEDYSCSCYYLRHPYNPMWQVQLIIKLGVVEPFINQ